MKKSTLIIIGIVLTMIACIGDVYALSSETFAQNYITTVLGCVGIATAMTCVYLNAIKEADENAIKYQKEKAKEKEKETKKEKKAVKPTKANKPKKESKKEKKSKTKSEGMSLVILVVTMVVMIIMAGSVVLTLEDSKMMDHGMDAKVQGVLDNVQHKLSEKVATIILETGEEVDPDDALMAGTCSRIGSTEYFRVDIASLALPKGDLPGIYITDNEYNVIYIEDDEYIFPEDATVPSDVLAELGM